MGFWEGKKTLVTGGKGFLGKYVVRELLKRGARPENIYAPGKGEADFTRPADCARSVKGKDIVIHLAGKVSGIGATSLAPGEFFYDNLIIGAQLMEEARKAEVKKFVAIGTVCSYPKFAPLPFREEDLWDGYPEESNAAYGLAKKMMIVQSHAYRQQYNFNSICLIPANLYGPGDNFDLEKSHVISALIKKFIDAKKNGGKQVVVWGSGRATREFLYVADAAEAIVLAAEKYDKDEPMNLGGGGEISIKELAEMIARLTGFNGKIVWDSSKPDGQPRRKISSERIRREIGFVAKTGLEQGLRETIGYYEKNVLPH